MGGPASSIHIGVSMQYSVSSTYIAFLRFSAFIFVRQWAIVTRKLFGIAKTGSGHFTVSAVALLPISFCARRYRLSFFSIHSLCFSHFFDFLEKCLFQHDGLSCSEEIMAASRSQIHCDVEVHAESQPEEKIKHTGTAHGFFFFQFFSCFFQSRGFRVNQRWRVCKRRWLGRRISSRQLFVIRHAKHWR